MKNILRQTTRKLTKLIIPCLAFGTLSAAAQNAPLKEWTFLVFLNANNNLDTFGDDDLNEMETVGSTDQVNVVVQWASYRQNTVKRLLVQKDENPTVVTSPILQDIGATDMGDWHNLVEFVKWAAEKYPAKKYFIDVWNHGSGWHRKELRNQLGIQDISFDDKTGHAISTEELGLAMKASAEVIGHKVDVYGSDACLMAMAEVASEMDESVSVFVGAQEVEPAEGWPYGDFLRAWNAAAPETDAKTVAQILATEFKKSYQGGSQGTREVTLSAFDLGKTEVLESAMKSLSDWILSSPTSIFGLFRQALSSSQSFYYSDYVDLGDFINKVSSRSPDRNVRAILDLQAAIKEYVIVNEVTPEYQNATGLSVWIPRYSYTFEGRQQRYSELSFSRATNWFPVLDAFFKTAP
jgi:hypothetical protein